jgi:hypothetical protein
MVMIGIYGCQFDETEGHPPLTRQCYSLVSFSAVSEWIMSICWVGSMATMGYETLHLRQWCEEMRTTRPPQSGHRSNLFKFMCCTRRRRPGALMETPMLDKKETEYGYRRDSIAASSQSTILGTGEFRGDAKENIYPTRSQSERSTMTEVV